MNLFRKLKLSCACSNSGIGLKCDGTRAETRFRLPAKRTSPFKSAGASVQSITGSRGVRICGSNGSNAAYTMFRGIVKGTGYPLHPPVSPSLPLPCVTVCHHISNGLYFTPHTPHLKQGDSETTLSPDLPSTRIIRSTTPSRKCFKSCRPMPDLVTRYGPQATTRFTCLVLVPFEHESSKSECR